MTHPSFSSNAAYPQKCAITTANEGGLLRQSVLGSWPMKVAYGIAGLVIVGFFGLSESNASTTVKINSHYYTCQNSCVVSTRPGGGFSVWDSKGGWVTKTSAPGEALVETGPVT
ncbi:hypothetical protein FJU31_13350 [Stenotrophomonas cyclobalanopsidis]|uniref:Uncharacterized protein n=1 Tax=Stenotrophomonas cyclobalanopsidis TaxID=2771362 RepID=A0ABQ6SYV7_9GAMM|nr:hypothetical protein [Stenotrophomonas cyclobalanopsidis]KAA8996260.1 hypothetical protein FJU31_13350 [Stenotrophomonas cyclobalanopsidis]